MESQTTKRTMEQDTENSTKKTKISNYYEYIDLLNETIISENHAEINRVLKASSFEEISKLDRHHQSPLHISVLYDMISVSRILILLGVPVNVKDSYGETPLHWAVRLKNEKMIIFLMELNADHHSLNHRKETPLSIAQNFSLENIIILLEANYDENNCFDERTLQDIPITELLSEFQEKMDQIIQEKNDEIANLTKELEKERALNKKLTEKK